MAYVAVQNLWFDILLNNIINKIVWPLFFGTSILMFLVAGFMFLTARGDPAKILTARKAVLWGIIGFAVGILAFSAPRIIQSVIP